MAKDSPKVLHLCRAVENHYLASRGRLVTFPNVTINQTAGDVGNGMHEETGRRIKLVNVCHFSDQNCIIPLTFKKS
jgi:hypothetical protein